MAQQIIDIGDAINDGTGDPARVAFTTSNDNFTDLYKGAGGASEGLWNFHQTSTDTSTTPVLGRFKTNSGNYRTATQIAIHGTTIQSINRTDTLRRLLAGDIIQCQDSTNSSAWCRYILQSASVDNGSWFQLNVALETDGGVASGDNQEIIFVFTANKAGGSSTSTVTVPQGRLTLQSGVPVMTTTQAAKTTIFYSPYTGLLVPLYDGTAFAMASIGTELSQTTTDTTKSPAAVVANSLYDLFVWNDAAGTMRCTRGPAWTSATARSAGTALVMVNGIWLNNAAITNGPAASRGTYVGTVRSNAASQIDWTYGTVAAGGGAGVFGVWNAYNRRLVISMSGNSVDTWSYASTTVRAANASTTFRHSFVCGLAEDAFEADYCAMAETMGVVGIGYDVTNAFSGRQGVSYAASNAPVTVTGAYAATALGFHFFQACEASEGTSNFYGDDGVPLRQQSGLTFRGWL